MQQLLCKGGCSPSLQQLYPHTPTMLDRGINGVQTTDNERALLTITTSPAESSGTAKRKRDQHRVHHLIYLERMSFSGEFRLVDHPSFTYCRKILSKFRSKFRPLSNPQEYKVIWGKYLKLGDILLFQETMKTTQQNNQFSINTLHFSGNPAKQQEKQNAFVVIFLKDGFNLISGRIFPQYPKNEKTVHSEEALIRLLENFSKNYGSNIRFIYIHSYYSPCLERCMPRIVDFATSLHRRYKIETHVGFKELWGKNGHNCLQCIAWNQCVGPSSVFHTYIDKCKDTRFKLILKGFRDIVQKKGIYRLLEKVKATDRQQLDNDIKKCLNCLIQYAQRSFYPRDHHIDHGLNIIAALECNASVREGIHKILLDAWIEKVNSSSVPLIRQTIAAELHPAVLNRCVNDLRSSLRENCPVHFHKMQRII